MFTIDSDNSRYIRVHAAGRLRARDYRSFEPAFEEALARRGGRAPLLLDLRGWRGWTPGGLFRDLRFDLRHRRSFPRIAVIGDRRWHEWLTYAAGPIFSGPMRYFDGAREREAIAWLER
jgi:SpoIIAA-like